MHRFLTLISILGIGFSPVLPATDHNEPNSLNSIFSDIRPDATDLYGLFGFPVVENGEEYLVMIATFSPAPAVNKFDDQVLHVLNLDPDRRPQFPQFRYDDALSSVQLAERLGELLKFLKRQVEAHLQPDRHPQIRISYAASSSDQWKVRLQFLNFTGRNKRFSVVQATNTIGSFLVNDKRVKYFVGGADDPFFTDLGGFFRSINYAPALNAPFASFEEPKELKRPKSLLTTDWAGLFSFPAQLVYTGEDSRTKYNVNAIALQIPVSLIAPHPSSQRVVRLWGEGYRIKASRRFAFLPSVGEFTFRSGKPQDYVRLDTLGVPFVDTVLGEREERFNTGANNLLLQTDYVKRFAHLGWGFGPSLTHIGFDTCFSFHWPLPEPLSTLGDVNRPIEKKYQSTLFAATRVAKCLLQAVRMPKELKWNRTGVAIEPPIVASLFHPNALAVDLDTTGTWPFGRRPEDQVASRFTALFLDLEEGKCGGKPCHLESLQDSSILPGGKPINPVNNDKPFRSEFPYLAEPWGSADEIK